MISKRIAIALLVVGLLTAVLLSAPAASKITLTFRHWGPNAGIDGTWKKFNKSQDEIEVVFDHVGGGEYIDKTMLEIAAGERPDMFSLQGWEGASMNFNVWMRDGLLYDLTPFWERDKYELGTEEWPPFIYEYVTYKGKLVGLPYSWAIANQLSYNADIFDDSGMLYPDESWTWDTLAAAAKKFLKTDSEGNVTQCRKILDLQNSYI